MPQDSVNVFFKIYSFALRMAFAVASVCPLPALIETQVLGRRSCGIDQAELRQFLKEDVAWIVDWVSYEAALSEKWNLLGGQGHKAVGQLDYFPRQRPGGCDG